MSRIRYAGSPSAPTPAIQERQPLRLTCRCGGEWRGTAQIDGRLLEAHLYAPELPLTADPGCPKCHDVGGVVRVAPW